MQLRHGFLSPVIDTLVSMRREEIPARPLPHRRLQKEDVEGASVDALASWLTTLEEEASLIEQNRAVVLAEFDERRGHDVYGHPSTISFLEDVCRMAGGRARRLAKAARAAARHTTTAAAWRFGQLSTDQAQQLFNLSDELADRYGVAEQVLLDIVGETPDQTCKVLSYWRNTVDPLGVEVDLDTQMERRSFDLTTQANGMVTGRFAMTGLGGEMLKTAIAALLPPPEPTHSRTAAQRRHDALVDLAASFLDSTNTITSGGEKPHVSVHCDLDALRAEAGGLHETADGTVLPIEELRQIACDSSVIRIVFASESEIIDVGRKTRVVPPALRRAVIARDRHCRAPGCNRSATWCDVHHVIHWADGGETVLANLVLLCRYHHTLTHRQDAARRLEEALGKEPATAGAGPP